MDKEDQELFEAAKKTRLKRIHETSYKARDLLNLHMDNKTALCGCFFCGRIYHPSEIAEWCDKGLTAICPRCGIDSVIDGIQNSLSYDLLEELHREYFLNGRNPAGEIEPITDTRAYKINDLRKGRIPEVIGIVFNETAPEKLREITYKIVFLFCELELTLENGLPSKFAITPCVNLVARDASQMFDEEDLAIREIERFCNIEVELVDVSRKLEKKNGIARLFTRKDGNPNTLIGSIKVVS